MKKHINRFSLVFNSIDNQQIFAMEVLNNLPQRRRSIYVAQAIVAYEKAAKKLSSASATTTTEKRGRGRPRKNPVSAETTILQKPVQTSLSHIQQGSPETSQITSELSLPPSSDVSTTVDDIMLASMLRFSGEQD